MMDNREKALILAKVHGWPIVDDKEPRDPDRPCPCIRDTGEALFLIHHDGWYGDGYESYDPATNVTQAIGAVEAWRGNIVSRFWQLESPFHHPDGDIHHTFQVFIYWDDGIDKACDAIADTPAQAICDALIKAVEDA